MVPRSKTTKTSRKPGSASAKKTSSKRELIKTKTDSRFVRRSSNGQFKESDDVGRSLAADRRRKAKTVAPKGQGDRGDQKTSGSAKKSTAKKTGGKK